MSEQINDGGPAFPCSHTVREPGREVYTIGGTIDISGMSLRDWFAGHALAMAGAGALAQVGRGQLPPDDIVNATVSVAFSIADALIAARNLSTRTTVSASHDPWEIGFQESELNPQNALAYRNALTRYAEEHTGDTGHEPNAPRPQRGGVAQFIFDTLTASNRTYAEQLRRERGQS